MEKYNAVRFVEENMKTIFAYALSRVSNKHDAEDLASEIVLAILQSGEKIKDPNAFYGFVWGIAANTYKNFLRKKSNNSHEDIPENFSSKNDFVEELCNREDINLLRRELSLLSKEYRECTIAYYFNRLSCAQISEKLGISPEMVKYYLFKTRKILKEGICMEREYGEKSYNPANFNFLTIFSGNWNKEYSNLFNRKLPGNIMLSTYYTPMTVRELSLELGVATPYLEDEVALLEKYDLLRRLNGNKYQTNLVIFTEAFTNEFYETSKAECINKLSGILKAAKAKLSDIRNIGFIGNHLDDNSLLWAFLWMLMRCGNSKLESSDPNFRRDDIIYSGATGVNYGEDYSASAIEDKYTCTAFAGFAYINKPYALSFADFGVLPIQNRYALNTEKYKELLNTALNDPSKAVFAVMTSEEIKSVENILAQEIDTMAEIYAYLHNIAVRIMQNHAPDNVKNQVDHIIGSTLFFRTAGFIGACALDSKELSLPNNDISPALYAYRYKESTAHKDVMCN